MPQLPDSRAVHINQPLNNVSVAYANAQQWVAPQAFPIVSVNQQGNLYWKYTKGDWYRGLAQVRAPATESAGGGWSLSTASYFAQVYAVHKDLDDQIRANADSNFNLESDATRWVTNQLLIKRDQLWAASFFTTGVWNVDLTGVAAAPGANQFLRWDQAGSDPVTDVTTQITVMMEQTGYKPNTLILGPYVYRKLINNSSIIDRIKYSGQIPAITTRQVLAQLFEVDNIIVAETIQNTGTDGGTDAFSYIFGKSALLCYSTPRPSLMEATAGYIFSWTGLLGAGSYGVRIKRFRMEELEADRIEGEMAFDQQVIAPDLGKFFATAVS